MKLNKKYGWWFLCLLVLVQCKKVETPIPEKEIESIPKAEEKKTTTAIPQQNKRSNIPNVLSMGFKKPEEKKEEKAVQKTVRDTVVSQIQIQENLQLFAQENKYNDMLFTALDGYDSILEGKIITIKVDNQFQATQISQNKQKILEFLDRKLNNNSLLINTLTTKEEGKVDKRAYSEMDKLKVMKEQNPELDSFMGQLKLKLEE